MTLSSTARQIIFWLLIIAGSFAALQAGESRRRQNPGNRFDRPDAKIDAGEIKQLTVKQNETVAIDTRNQELRAQLTNDQMKNELFKKANEKNSDGRTRGAASLKTSRAAAAISGRC